MYIITILGLAVLSGILGRMGGARGYDTLYRDLGCPAVLLIALQMTFGMHPLIYIAVALLMWGALSTYWQFLFKGVDNMWLSGFMVGMSLMPVIWIDFSLIWVVLGRAVALCVVWGCLNKFLPKMEGRDVAEEFTRYAVAL